MDGTIEYLTKQISILRDATDPQDAEFVCYRFGQNDQNTKSYAVSQLAQTNAILISYRTGIYDHGYGIAYINNDTPYLMHDIAFNDFIDVLTDRKFTHGQLAVIIKNCTPEHQRKILSYLENKKLDAIIESNNSANYLVF